MEEQALAQARAAAALTRESPAAATALRAAALLPPDTVPWPWLKEVTAARHPEIGAEPRRWDELRARLESLRLLAPGPTPEVARLRPALAADLATTLTGPEAVQLGAALREVVGVRLRQFKAERQRLFGEVVRGNAGPEAAGWYVAPLEEVQARAAAAGSVEVTPVDDGFQLALKGGASWEEPCFQAFLRQQFASDRPDALEWVLRADELSAEELEGAGDRLRALHAGNPDGVAEAKLLGLYLLNLARALCARWGGRSAWPAAVEASELFQRLHERHPADPEITALLEQANHARWLYDW